MPQSPTSQGGILSALLPGARIDKHTNKILVHSGTSNETIIFNVGGTKFETYKSTLRAIPSSPLSKDSFLEKHYRPEHSDYFFDRDPAIFHCVLNFFRTGELHLSSESCGPMVKSELEFWGVDELDIEECCWSRYSGWVSTLQALRKLEEDRSTSAQYGEYPLKESPSRYKKACRAAWQFFIDPHSSIAAQYYAYFSLAVIIISIFSFCAQTHRAFQVDERELVMRSPSSSATSSVTASFAATTATALTTSSLFSSPISNATTAQPTPTLPNNNTTIGPNGEIYEIEIHEKPHHALYITDQICLVYFLIELLIRIIVSPIKLRFLTRPITVVEILALLPDIVDGIIRLAISDSSHDYEIITDALNFLKLLRVFRILRLMRQVPGLWILIYTLRASIADLLLLLMFVSVGMLISASLVYFAERHTQPDFSSIPKCFWWALITMTTVGYGDMSPTTAWGYLVGSVTSISGVLMVGFAVPVLVNNFIMYYSHTTSTIQRDKHQRAAETKGSFNLNMLGTFGKSVLGSAGGGGLAESRRNSLERPDRRKEAGVGFGGNGAAGKDSNDNDTTQQTQANSSGLFVERL